MSSLTPDLERLSDRYELGEEIGRGGFGVVRRGRCRRTDREVAAKIMLTESTPQERQRIYREVASIQSMRSPRLVELLDLCRHEDGGVALIYELVSGSPLAEELQAGAIEPERALSWLWDLVEALETLHVGGFVHRDVKPENAMLEPDGHVRLLDYGLVRSQDSGHTLTQEGLVVGTPQYMAPEQLEGRSVGPATDQYALACLAWQLFAGQLPFLGEPAEIVSQKLHGGALAGVIVGPQGPVLARGLATNPAERYPTCRAFVQALETASGDENPTPFTRVLPSGRKPLPAQETRTNPRQARPRTGDQNQRQGLSRVTKAAGLVLGMGMAILIGSAGFPAVPNPATRTRHGPAVALSSEDSTGLPVAWVDEVLDELGEAATWKMSVPRSKGKTETLEVLNLDLDTWGSSYEQLSKLRRVHSWMAQGGRPEDLPEQTTKALSKADKWYRNQRLGRPFRHFQVRPLAQPVRVDSLALVRNREGGRLRAFKGEVGGWAGTALILLEQLLTRLAAYKQELELFQQQGQLPPEFNLPALFVQTGRISRGLQELYTTLDANAFGLRHFRIYAEEGAELLQQLIYAIGRSLREQPQLLREHFEFVQILHGLDTGLYYAPFVFQPIEVSDGGPLRGAATMVFRALCLDRALTIQAHFQPASQLRPLRSQMQGLLLRATQESFPTESPDDTIQVWRSWTWYRWAMSLRDSEDPSMYLRCVRQVVRGEDPMGPKARHDFYRSLLDALAPPNDDRLRMANPYISPTYFSLEELEVFLAWGEKSLTRDWQTPDSRQIRTDQVLRLRRIVERTSEAIRSKNSSPDP